MRRFFATWIALAWLFLPAARSVAQGTLSTIFTNGPITKRINLVVLAEGYQTNESAKFLLDATNAVNSLLAVDPYQEYKKYFNAYAIFVASAQSGSDHPNYPQYVDTYFNSRFYSYGIPQLVTIPPNDVDANYSNGQGKVDALLQSLMPEYDLKLMLVNDPTYGGSGDNTVGTLIASLDMNFFELIRHESGHALGALTDEYTNAYAYTPVEKPNATAQTNRALIKWTSWIPTNTPIPTPQDPTNAQVVGLFQGAEFHPTGWYRPKLDCKMNHLNVTFCEVCSEQLVKSIYQLVRAVDSFSPAATNVSVTSTQAVSFSVMPLQPTTHNLAVQWYTNNAAVNGATNTSFQLLPKVMSNGPHTVRAVVYDPTSFVRSDPTSVLRATNTWSVAISLNELSLKDALYLSDGRFRLSITGAAPQGFVIQGSTNLVSWASLSTNDLSGGLYQYTNSSPLDFPWRFYRTYSPP